MSDIETIVAEFRRAMAEAGIPFTGEIKPDKARHRFKAGEDKNPDSWYILHPDGEVPAGAFGCWRRQVNQRWHYANGRGSKMSPKAQAECRRKWAEAEAQNKKEQEESHARLATELEGKFQSFPKAKNHPYLQKKQVSALGDLRVHDDGRLIIPLQDASGRLWSCQTISATGDKLFMRGGRVQGCFYLIGKYPDGPLVICEGYATGASIHRATGWPVACAMNCGNLKEVATELRKNHPEKILILAADDDRFTDGNPGLTKADEAAEACSGKVCRPQFPKDSKGTDFNDLAVQCGEGEVRIAFHELVGSGMGQRITIDQLLSFTPTEDPDSVLGDRFLCKGGSCCVVAQTSAGKSSMGMQMAILWALGLDFFGLRPRKPLRSLIIQAENDVGDTAEMFQGVILGLSLASADDPEGLSAVKNVLNKNLIIVRDQTHIGMNFPEYAAKMIEIHKPDLLWVDPLLSFFGDDINSQKEMGTFLRSGLNPISERTGVIWMLLHHTGKPSKEANKSQKSWSARDFAYLGIGSSELSNWARAIITVVSTSEDEFKMIMAKRGKRAQIVDEHGNPTTELNLAHSTDLICWKRIPKPKEDNEMDNEFASFARSINSAMSATDIIRRAADKLQRGARTCWKFWGSGSGPLGKMFEKQDSGKWLPKGKSESKPYTDS